MEETRRDEDQGVVWCARCGIPHAAGATYCSHCGQPLGPAAGVATSPTPAELPRDASTATPPDMAAVAPPAPAVPPAEPTADTGPLAWPAPAATVSSETPRNRAAGATRLPRRTEPASEAEIEAAAAAIVAQARTLDEARERSDDASITSAPGATPELPESPAPWSAAPRAPSSTPPSLFAAMPERERIWLIAGIVLCVLLVLFAIAFARNLGSVG